MKPLVAVLLLVFFNSANGSERDSAFHRQTWFNTLGADSRDYLTAPFKWKGKQWTRAAAMAGATILLTTADEPARDIARQVQSPFLTGLSRYGLEPFGETYTFVFVGGMIAAGEISGRDRTRSTGYLAAESLLLSGLVARIPKLLLGRQRPDAWPPASPYDFKGPLKGSSFPSGHTTAVFSVASVVAYQYRNTRWVPPVAYSIAGLTGISRIYDDRHWLSDVVAGALLGTVTGIFLCKNREDRALNLQPAYAGGVPGFKVSVTW